MLLSELFDYLTSGELSQVSMGDMDDLVINVEDYPKVIPAVNLAVIELHKRFPLRLEEVTIRQQDHISIYHLNSKYAVSNTESTEPIKYIHDSIYEPFKDNILVIDRVFNEIGTELSLNGSIDYGEAEAYRDTRYQSYYGHDLDHAFQSVKTPTYNSVQILPTPISDNNLLIVYRSAPPPIKLTSDIRPGEIEVEVSLALLEPLLLYVGGRTYANMQGKDPNSGMGFLTRFEASCQKIDEQGLYNVSNTTNTKLERAGWR